ncbi:hypothetical protein SLE2022_142810 [Rubroshorea leprosula]
MRPNMYSPDWSTCCCPRGHVSSPWACAIGPVARGPQWVLGLISTLLPPQCSVDELGLTLVMRSDVLWFVTDLTHDRPGRLEDIVPGRMCKCIPASCRAGVRS